MLRFRSTASPEAFRLAGHLAVGEPQLPVMRLVQAAVEERPRPQHLAEVILSGMLASGGAAGAYEFRDGVRELLLRTLPRTARGRTRELLARVGGLIDERAGAAPGVLRAVAPSGGGAGPGAPVGEPFATVTRDSARRLGGGRDARLLGDRYRLVRRIGHSGRVWLAEDLRQGGRPVAVQRYPQAPQWLRHGFTRAARQLSRFRHAQVAAVHDYANGEVPYLVMEFIEGRNLAELLADHPNGLPTHYLLDLIPSLARAVSALDAEGLAHGALSPAYVRIPPQGGAVLCGFTLAPYREESGSADLRSLGRLVHEMYDGTEVAAGLRDILRSAVEDLDSPDADRRRQGLHQLTQLTQLSVPASRDRTYSLLGPLHVTQNGHLLTVGKPEQQALLCMLLLKRGRTVPFAELTEGIWGPAFTPRAEGDLRNCAHRLANTLAPDTLVADDIGYALPLPYGPDVVDLFHCQRLAADAQDARFAGTSRAPASWSAPRSTCGGAPPWRTSPARPPRPPAPTSAACGSHSSRHTWS
ncbi:protein kinase [Streptomyces rectiviolaceus]|uniref:protein kinase n=1 Tax=Streptomyces rectiviolaceus TaxID=332591 RepID=UPI0036324164